VTARRRWIVAALASGLGAGCTAGPIQVAALVPGDLASDLVAHWTFDEGIGATVHDSSGNGRDGTLFGTGWTWTAGRFASAVHFSGVDQVTVPTLPQATESYSVSAWLLLASSELGPSSPPGPPQPTTISGMLSTETLSGGWTLYGTFDTANPSYAFRYWVGPPDGYEMGSCSCVVPNAWVHLAAVVDAAASSLTFYVNGVPQGTAATSGQTISPGAMTLDMARAQSPGYGLTGALDDIALYDRALVPQEVSELAQAAAPDPR
jgi:hypothetical protein